MHVHVYVYVYVYVQLYVHVYVRDYLTTRSSRSFCTACRSFKTCACILLCCVVLCCVVCVVYLSPTVRTDFLSLVELQLTFLLLSRSVRLPL